MGNYSLHKSYKSKSAGRFGSMRKRKSKRNSFDECLSAEMLELDEEDNESFPSLASMDVPQAEVS